MKRAKRAMTTFKDVRENITTVYVEFLGISQEDKIEGSLWRETSSWSLEPHDTAEPVGEMCHGKLPEKHHPPLHYIVHKKRMKLTYKQPSAPSGVSYIPSREQSSKLSSKTRGPFGRDPFNSRAKLTPYELM